MIGTRGIFSENETDILLKTFNENLKKYCSIDREAINNLISEIPEYHKEKAINLIKNLSLALINIYKSDKKNFYDAVQSIVSLFNNELLINKYKRNNIDIKKSLTITLLI